MRELSLHILDLIENSLRAEATTIAVAVEALPQEDRLRIVIEDDGRGLRVSPDEALDPFYTTKQGKRTGLGLALFRAAAAASGGNLTIGRSDLGGTAVRAELGLTHVDRTPLGDLAATLSSVVCTNPEIDFRFRLRVGGQNGQAAGEQEWQIHVKELAETIGRERGGLAVAQEVRRLIEAALAATDVLR